MDESILSKSDNIDSIKYIAAVMVIICHSFVLSTTELGSWAQFMNNHIAFGAIGVAIFFFLSGLLVTQSMMRYKSVKKFLKVRALRIFPPLAVVVTLTMVMGMFITNLQVQDYWLNPNTLRYLLNIVLIRQHYLPGVFENNPYAGAVNGSLWTLLFEFICYILTCIVYKLKMLARHHILLTIPIMICGLAIIYLFALKYNIDYSYIGTIVRPCICYYMGMLLFFYHEYLTNTLLLYAAIILSVIGLLLNSVYFLLIFIIPVLILNVGWGIKKTINKRFASLGKYSYGIYLTAFPLQQLLVFYLGEMNPFVNCIVTIFLSTVLGKIIYKYIETPIGALCIRK